MGRRILFWVIIILFIAALGIVGFYFYRLYFPSLDKVDNSTPNPKAILNDIRNGGNLVYPQNVGGIDDYNNGATMPADTYYVAWEVCNNVNDFCNTGDSQSEKKDPNTGLIWSNLILKDSDWFVANNCKYPNGLPGDDGICDVNGEVACNCVKNATDNKTGCDSLGGGWRLPYQKELMQAYIDGSYANLTEANNGFWSSTTRSDWTETAWASYLNYGNTSRNDKTVKYAVRCVR